MIRRSGTHDTTGVSLAPTSGMILGLLVMALSSGLTGSDPYHNQGPLAFLVKDIQKPVAVSHMEWQDRALQLGSSALIFGDWLTTVDGIRKGYSETNPILGVHPSLGRANVLIASGLLANAFLVSKIKDKELRRGIWFTMVLLEMKAVHGNHRAGLNLNFRL
jgi:tetrahydromethanopterin S-methyltransferase subunit B